MIYQTNHTGPGSISYAIEFQQVFTVREDLTIELDTPNVWCPDLYWECDENAQVFGEPELDERWTLYGNHSRQQGGGAIMHASESFAGALADDVLSEPGTYALVICESLGPIGLDLDDPVGWAVIQMLD